jgi:hypothetical protein
VFIDLDDKMKMRLDDGSLKEIIFASGGPAVDKNYVHPFTALSVIVVTHSLAKIPTVQIIEDSTNRLVKGQIVIDAGDENNKLTVTLNSPITGRVICN